MDVSALPGYRWTGGGDSPNAATVAIGVGATALLFAAAFLAMTSVRELRERAAEQGLEPPRVVTLTPPEIAPSPKPRAEAPAVPVPRSPIPFAVPTPAAAVPVGAQPTIVQPITGAPAAGNTARDSAANRRAAEAAQSRELTELRPPTIGPLHRVPRTLGTPPEPAGVAIHNKALTPEDMAAMANGAMAGMASYARAHRETPEEIEAQNRGSHPPPLQNGPAGDMRRGTGTIQMGSIPFPLFSPGLSPAQRKRNAVIDSEYQLRLRRLEDRAALVRDSVRADSVRRDSLARVRRP